MADFDATFYSFYSALPAPQHPDLVRAVQQSYLKMRENRKEPVEDDLKFCAVCKTYKPVEDFGTYDKGGSERRYTRCIQCRIRKGEQQ